MGTLLVIVDGMGLSDDVASSAVTRQTMPNLFRWMDEYGFARLVASGKAVGLDIGQSGNSETGHLTLGAGRRIPSVLEKVNQAFVEGSWGSHSLWQKIS